MGKQNRLIVAGFERGLRRIMGAGQSVGNKAQCPYLAPMSVSRLGPDFHAR
jgi:hypothetical protein